LPNLVGTLVGVAVFGFVTSVTPGPNNTFLLTSGLNFGLRRSIAYINGIIAGLIIMISSMYLGIGALFRAYPIVQETLKYLGFAYILYMAYSIVRSSFNHKHEIAERVGFFRSVAFQMVNPKAWIVVMSTVAAYVPVAASLPEAISVIAVFLIATYPGAVVWAAFGEVMADWLKNEKSRRIFNISAAVLLVVSMVPVLFL
jgi:threonine/homoserine/homoserine lactone efflux protein